MMPKGVELLDFSAFAGAAKTGSLRSANSSIGRVSKALLS